MSKLGDEKWRGTFFPVKSEKQKKNPAILDTSNEFMGLHIEVHSGVTKRGT